MQARVPRELEETLKHEARRRRLTVSHLVRTVLEDTFLLVDDLVQDVDRIVGDSVTLARRFGRARRTRSHAEAAAGTGPSEEARGVPPGAGLDEVEAWTPVVLNRAVRCDSCEARLDRGEPAYAGIGAPAPSRRVWLCERCVEALR